MAERRIDAACAMAPITAAVAAGEITPGQAVELSRLITTRLGAPLAFDFA